MLVKILPAGDTPIGPGVLVAGDEDTIVAGLVASCIKLVICLLPSAPKSPYNQL